jgi:hypothetical protein
MAMEDLGYLQSRDGPMDARGWLEAEQRWQGGGGLAWRQTLV